MFSAEYGTSMGSQTNIVSKSGTNQWHGDVFEYLTARVKTYGDVLIEDIAARSPTAIRNSLPPPMDRLSASGNLATTLSC